jgi:acetylglutamate kinase
MREVVDKARVLIEALPYIRAFRGRTFVVKIGGRALEDLVLRQRFAEDVVLLHWVGIQVVVVHGGGAQISGMLERLGIEPTFVDGLRVTDERTLEVVEMVLGGGLNKEIVRLIDQVGGRAVGITGKDGGLARARRRTGPRDLGLVGDIEAIDRSIIDHLLPAFIPIVAPLAVDPGGQTLNVNADTFAAHLAVATGAEKLVLLPEGAGVVHDAGRLLSTLAAGDARRHIEDGVISGGMIPKVENALEALAAGVHKVHIIDGRAEHALLLEIFTRAGVGTQVVPDPEGPPARKDPP